MTCLLKIIQRHLEFTFGKTTCSNLFYISWRIIVIVVLVFRYFNERVVVLSDC
jgi:hypothetical protein